MVITQTRPAPEGSLRSPRAPWLRGAALPLGTGAAVALVDGIGAGIPSYWGDEAASVMSGTRSLPSLLNELSAVDAVHGIYYMLLHVWMWAFGTGEWATRSLSVLAIGALAAGVVVLGRMWFGRGTAIVAGLLVAVIPRASTLAIETRGYAITAAAVVWLVVLFTHLARSGASRRRWVMFGVLAGVCSWFFLYLLLVPLALCAVLLALPRWAEEPHRNVQQVRADMLAAIGSAFIGALPILALAALQRNQVSFLAHRGYLSPKGVLITPWFSSSAVAVVMWALIVVGVLVALTRTRQRAQGALALAWLLGPALALIAVDVIVAPTYNPRYLSVSLGAVALLAAHGITGIVRGIRLRYSALAPIAAVLISGVVLSVAVPQYLHQRTPYAKDGGADFQAVAASIGEHARPGDIVLFGEGPRPSRTARLAYRLYPTDFAGLRDPQLVTSFTDRAGLWDDLAPVSAVAPTLPSGTVWLLESAGAQSAAGDLAALRQQGYVRTGELRLHRTTVYEFTEGVHHE